MNLDTTASFISNKNENEDLLLPIDYHSPLFLNDNHPKVLDPKELFN